MQGDPYEAKILTYIAAHGIRCEHLSFAQSCHSVAEAARAVQAAPEDFVKNICLITAAGELVVAIVKGEDRASAVRVGKLLNIPTPRLAKPDEILALTGCPCGGTPSFGYPAAFLIDPRVFERSLVYTGGGSETSLVRVAPDELLRANGGRVVEIRA